MAVGFDNAHLQQHLVEKLQERISQEADTSTEKAANPSDVAAFKEQIANGGQTSNLQKTSETSSVEKVNSGLSAKTPGHRILDTLEGMSKDATQIENAASADNMGVSETLRMQIQVNKLSAEESVLSSTAGKASKDVDSLLKGQ